MKPDIKQEAVWRISQNPVLVHEMRSRMRGARAYWILLAYLAVVTGALGVGLFGAASRAQGSGLNLSISGSDLLGPLIAVQAVLLALIAPAVTCGAITLEREHQRYDLLAATRLDAATTLAGKLAAALGFLFLCLLSSLPLAFAVTAFGGVAPADILGAYALLALEALVLGSVGLFWSTVTRSTIVSTALTYPSVLLACLAAAPFGSAAVDPGSITAPAFCPDLGSLFPLLAGVSAGKTAPFFGASLPYPTAGLILGPLIGGLIFCLAVQKLERFAQPRSRPAAILATLILWFLALALTGNALGNSDGPPQRVLVLWGSIFLLLAVAVPFAATLPGSQSRIVEDPLRSAQGFGLAALWITLGLGTAFVGLSRTARAGVFPDLSPDHLHEWAAVSQAACFLLSEAALVVAVSQWTRRRDAGAAVGGGLAAVGITLPVFSALALGGVRAFAGFTGISPLCMMDFNASEPAGSGWLGLDRLGLQAGLFPSWLLVCESYLAFAAILLVLAYAGERPWGRSLSRGQSRSRSQLHSS